MADSTAGQLLAIDAGNTRVKLGLIETPGPEQHQLPSCAASATVAVGGAMPWDELPVEHHIPAFVTGSNPNEIERICDEWPADRPAPSVIADRSRFPLVIVVDFPEKVGIDRLLNAVAANVVRETDQPVVIVDSGTATTVDYVDADGRFRGGAILPGFDLCARALNQYTALLPIIEMSAVLRDETPPEEIGRNTEAAITAGLYWGHVGAVKELVQSLFRASEGGGDPLLLLTGGAAPLLQPHLAGTLQWEPHLALQGLALVARSDESFNLR